MKGSGTKCRIKRKFPTLQPSLIATWSVLPFSFIPFVVSFHVLPCRRPHAPSEDLFIPIRYYKGSSEFKYRIIIKDAPKKTTVWTVIGVDEDNWWNEYAPGMDCMKEFAPGPHYDPSVQVNVLCTGKQVDDAMCSYLVAVTESRQRTSNSVIFIGAGVLGRSRGGRSSKELRARHPNRRHK